MNAYDLEAAIQEALLERDENHADLHGEPQAFARIVTYADAGVLTRDAGLVIRTTSGDEFQITIVQTRRGQPE